MIAPIENAPGSGAPTPAVEATTTHPTPVATIPYPVVPAIQTARTWYPAGQVGGGIVPPSAYARFGESPSGLLDWAKTNEDHQGIPGAYNAAVLVRAAGTMQAMKDDLVEIKSHLRILRRVLDGESLQNDAVKASFRAAIESIEANTLHVEVIEIRTNVLPSTETPATPAA